MLENYLVRIFRYNKKIKVMERVKKEMVERTYLLDRGVMVTVKGEDVTEPQTWDVSVLDINTSVVEELKGVHAYRVSEILNS